MRSIVTSHAVDAPRDGDCLAVSRSVTDALLAHGLAASSVTIAGWTDPEAKIIGFLHEVTVFDGFVLDGTARQFSTDLPAAWIAPIEVYLRELAAATDIDHASFFPAQPPCQDRQLKSP